MKTYVKDIGIDIEKPEKVCDDEKCPWHGKIRIHGILIEGKVIKRKFRIAKIEYFRHVYLPKYKRYEIRRYTIKAYVPKCLEVKEGDYVIIGETRPLSKTIHFVVINKK